MAPGAPGEHPLDALERVETAEILRVRRKLTQAALRELCRGHRRLAAGHEVDQGRLEPVAGGEPLVLGHEQAMERGRRVPLLDLVDQLGHERLDVGRQRHRVLEVELHVHHPHLERAEPRVWPDVPPETRVVDDRAGALEPADGLGVIVVAVEARRQT